MTESRYHRAKEIFLEAKRLSGEARERLLRSACGDDAELRAEVDRLLRHDERPLIDLPDTVPTARAWSSPGSGPTAACPSSPPQIPDYELIRAVGRGALGEVWLSRNRHTRHLCAVKVVPLGETIELHGLQEYKRRVGDHAHLVPIEHVGEVAEGLYCVMPLADNGKGTSAVLDPADYAPYTLDSHRRRRGTLSPRETAAIGEQVAAALAHLHAEGVIHGDVKPANVMLFDRTWKLGDLGLVTDAEARQVRGRTPAYAPPERDAAGPGVDTYALGRTLLELLTGHEAVDPESLEESFDHARGVDRARRHLLRLCTQLCAKTPAKRLAAAAVVRDELAAIARCKPDRDGWRPMRWILAAALVILVAGVAIIAGAILGSDASDADAPLPTHESEMRPPVMIEQVEITKFDTPYYVGDPRKYRGTLEENVVSEGDSVEIHAEFSVPAYCYLIALDTQGGYVLCHPGRSDEPPRRRKELSLSEDKVYQFNEGQGLHAFVLVASSAPLPAFDAWEPTSKMLEAWRSKSPVGPIREQGPVVYHHHDGITETLLARSRGLKSIPEDVPEPFRTVTDELANSADDIRAKAFPVRPRREREKQETP